MALNAFWVHGTVAEAEWPDRLANCPEPDVGMEPFRRGSGAEFFQTSGMNWFHFPIPTTVILNDTRMKLGKVFALYRTTGGARITAVHIWDGNQRIKTFDGLSLSGDFTNPPNCHIPQCSWIVSPAIDVKYGLVVCVQVQFTTAGSVLFATAGVDCA